MGSVAEEREREGFPEGIASIVFRHRHSRNCWWPLERRGVRARERRVKTSSRQSSVALPFLGLGVLTGETSASAPASSGGHAKTASQSGRPTVSRQTRPILFASRASPPIAQPARFAASCNAPFCRSRCGRHPESLVTIGSIYSRPIISHAAFLAGIGASALAEPRRRARQRIGLPLPIAGLAPGVAARRRRVGHAARRQVQPAAVSR